MNILQIDSSISGEASVTRHLTASIVKRLAEADPAATIIHRDLAAQPLPHLTLEDAADHRMVDEFLAADAVVVGAPMYNFTLPTQLKAWIDRLLVPGRTFRYTETGSPEGLAGGTRVIIALARGDFYSAGTPAAAVEHLESYLRDVFGFIGSMPQFVIADGIAIGPEQRERAMGAALHAIDLIAA